MIALVVLYPMLIYYYIRKDNQANIVYNSVIIVNVLWALNREKFKYKELLEAGLVILAEGASYYHLRSKANNNLSKTKKERTKRIVLNICSCIGFFTMGWVTDNWTFTLNSCLSGLMMVLYELLYINIIHRKKLD